MLNMLLKVMILLNLLAYSWIVGQAYMYIIALRDVTKKLDAASYIHFRQLTDVNFMAKYKYVMYGSLLTSLLLCIFTAGKPGSFLFISSVIAFAALVADVLLAVKGNVPINKLVNTWSADKYPANWQTYRDKWLHIYSKRQVANIAGFTSLLLGTVFGT